LHRDTRQKYFCKKVGNLVEGDNAINFAPLVRPIDHTQESPSAQFNVNPILKNLILNTLCDNI
jgi:hypothetical protein